MASGISRGNHSVSWAPRSDPSPSTSSPSTSRVPIHGRPEQAGSSSCQGATPLPTSSDTDSLAMTNSFRTSSSQERSSAPPALDPVSPDPPPRSGVSHQGWSQVLQEQNPPSDPDPPSTPRLEIGAYPGVQAGTRGEGSGTDDSGSHGPRLSPVAEEVHTENSIEEAQPHMTILSATLQGYSESRVRDASWGETFKVEWLSTERVQFHQTRHLRNPWNHDREIKVSRDGTELEPTVGQQLVDTWSSLASVPAGSDDARRLAGRRGRKFVPKQADPSTEPKSSKEEL